MISHDVSIYNSVIFTILDSDGVSVSDRHMHPTWWFCQWHRSVAAKHHFANGGPPTHPSCPMEGQSQWTLSSIVSAGKMEPDSPEMFGCGIPQPSSNMASASTQYALPTLHLSAFTFLAIYAYGIIWIYSISLRSSINGAYTYTTYLEFRIYMNIHISTIIYTCIPACQTCHDAIFQGPMAPSPDITRSEWPVLVMQAPPLPGQTRPAMGWGTWRRKNGRVKPWKTSGNPWEKGWTNCLCFCSRPCVEHDFCRNCRDLWGDVSF